MNTSHCVILFRGWQQGFISEPHTSLVLFYLFSMEVMYYPDLQDYSEKHAFYIAAQLSHLIF